MGRRFEDQVVWITGASGGIGEALALAFAREGAHLVLSARRATELERVARACAPARAEVVPLDVADTGTLAMKVDEVIRRVGHVDVMVHNAGISQRGLVLDTDLSVDRRLMEVNYFGVVALTKALLPHMLRAKGGRFVVVSSLAGLFGTKLRSAYCASKHALHGFFDSLDAELHEHGIRVTMVTPGFVRTRIGDNAVRSGSTGQAAANTSIEAGMPAEEAAAIILDAVARDAATAMPGGKERLGALLKRVAPGVLRTVMRKQTVT